MNFNKIKNQELVKELKEKTSNNGLEIIGDYAIFSVQGHKVNRDRYNEEHQTSMPKIIGNYSAAGDNPCVSYLTGRHIEGYKKIYEKFTPGYYQEPSHYCVIYLKTRNN